MISALADVGRAVMVIRTFLKHRKEMDKFLASNRDGSIDSGRYYRLVFLSCMDTLITFPISIYFLWVDITGDHYPYVNWENVHSDFHRIDQILEWQWRQDRRTTIILAVNSWTFVLSSVIFFVFWGFTADMKKLYSAVFWHFASLFGLQRKIQPNLSVIRFGTAPDPSS